MSLRVGCWVISLAEKGLPLAQMILENSKRVILKEQLTKKASLAFS